jgi:hypothetical protein
MPYWWHALSMPELRRSEDLERNGGTSFRRPDIGVQALPRMMAF